jgi:hypothetical protein
MRFRFLVLWALCMAAPAQAADDALAGLRWGMNVDEVARVLGERAQRLDPPIDYGAGQARLYVKAMPVGAATMTAFYQFGADDKLRQVLLERRDAGSTPKAFAAIDQALRKSLGKPAVACDRQRGTPRLTERRWRTGGTGVRLTFMDFTGAAMTLDPSKDFFDPRLPSYEYETFKRRAFPRRIVLRYFPVAEAELAGPPACE